MKIDFYDILYYFKEEKKCKNDEKNFVFAINLDVENNTEHIIIGEEFEVLKAINSKNCDLFFNEKFQLGNFFYSFPIDSKESWKQFCDEVPKLYSSMNFPKNCKNNMKFLSGKFETNNPVNMITSLQIFFEMLRCYSLNNASNIFQERISYLYKYFLKNEVENLWEVYKTDEGIFNKGENDLKLYCANGKEYIMVYKSFKPLIDKYLLTLSLNNLTFKKCSICGKPFLANHRTKKFCSDNCLKIQVAKNKEVFNENSKDVEYAKPYNSTYTFWYNRIKRLRNVLVDDEENLHILESRFKDFKVKSKEYKIKIKGNSADIKEFFKFLKNEEIWINNFYEKFKN